MARKKKGRKKEEILGAPETNGTRRDSYVMEERVSGRGGGRCREKRSKE